MLSRRFSAKVSATALVCQRRNMDHGRWYGHALELDIYNYKYTGEQPAWQKPVHRSADELKMCREIFPKVDFASCYEALIFDADRLHPHINRKEFGNEVSYRLEKQANTVARVQQLVKSGQYASDPKVEDTMIARIADEEHVQAEMKYVKCIRANELSEDNRLDILPGGSPNSLREKTRWNLNLELHPVDRREIGMRLNAWLPEKYHIVYFDDFQTVAANDAAARQEFYQIVENVAKEHQEEAKAGGWEGDLQEVVKELQAEIDPSRHITTDAIKKCSSLDQLEEWSHVVHEYNGDGRIFDIYDRATELTKDAKHQQLAKDIRKWYDGR